MRIWAFLFLVCTISFVACGDDDELLTDAIHLDGDNGSAPLLDPGVNEAAAQFSSTLMSNYADRDIKSIRFYLYDTPQECEILLYRGGNNGPGEMIYSSNFTNSTSPDGWNIHVLQDPITLDGSELWVSVRMNHPTGIQSIGCDNGPARSGGDWLLEQEAAGNWLTFRDITITQSINWNIRLDLVEL